MSIKQYQLYCDCCGYKRFSDGSGVQDLIQIKSTDIPRSSPYLDPITKKTIIPLAIKQAKKFKCPKCGYIIKPRIVQFMEGNSNETSDSNGSQTSSQGPAIS